MEYFFVIVNYYVYCTCLTFPAPCEQNWVITLDKFEETHEFYYSKDKLIYYFYKKTSKVSNKSDELEKKCYFDDGNMIKYLVKNIKPKKETNIEATSSEFKNQETEIYKLEKISLSNQR